MLKTKLALASSLAGIASMIAIPGLAEESANVALTVTPQVISVTVTDGDVAYGVLSFSETNNTFDGDAQETQTITNQSNIPVDISVSSTDATGTTEDWELADTPGAATFSHLYDIDATGSATWSNFPDDNSSTTPVVTLDENGGTDDNASLDLRLDMPTSSTDTTQHSVSVTVLATESI